MDLVLLDYVMPGMNGGAVAHKMKIVKPLVPVMIVSASSIEEEIPACVDCLISKGEGPGVLLEKIEQLLAKLSNPQLLDQERSPRDSISSRRRASGA